VWEITFDNIGGKSSAETTELSQPLVVGADDSKMRGASFAGTFGHGTQPDRLILLSDALWHRSQVFRINPTIAIILGGQDKALPVGIDAGGIEHLCSSYVSVKDTESY
jgi:hypothetical protein